jgi:hypothetical protein
MTQKALGMRLGERGFKQGKVGQNRGWKGLRLKTAFELKTNGPADPEPVWMDDSGLTTNTTMAAMMGMEEDRWA